MRIWLTVPVIFLSLGFFSSAQENTTTVAIDEHLGQFAATSATFMDENGQPVRLGALVDKPTLLTLVYFRCPSICSPFLNGVADVMGKLELRPGKDYQVITVSFDPRETPELAREKKTNYLKLFTTPYPENAWRFLTGDPAAIRALTGSVGYLYKRQGEDFSHPVAMMVLSPEGKIVRYLYGMSFLPFDVKMALVEASQGRVGSTTERLLLYCFSYDPEGKTYVFNILKVTGTLTILIIALFLVFLAITGRRRKEGEKPQ